MTACTRGSGVPLVRVVLIACAMATVAMVGAVDASEVGQTHDGSNVHLEDLLIHWMARIATALAVIVLLGKVIEWTAQEVARSVSEIADAIANAIGQVRDSLKKVRDRLKASTPTGGNDSS